MSRPLLEVRDVVCQFGEFRAIAGVSVDVHEGEWHGLIGPNGAGKSTFFNVLTGVVRPKSGELRFDGRSIAGHSPDRIARAGVGRTFQAVRTFPGKTVQAHVRVAAEASPRGTRDHAEAALVAVGLADRRDRLAGELPHVERKQLAIAMCLSMRPRLLLLDEPTAGLDDSETATFGEMLRDVHRSYGLTSILVEHKLSFVMGLSNTVTVLDHGKVIANGTPEQVAADALVIEAYLGKQEVDDA